MEAPVIIKSSMSMWALIGAMFVWPGISYAQNSADLTMEISKMVQSENPIVTSWEAVLQRHVQAPDAETALARFDYAALNGSAKDVAALEAYIDYLQTLDPDAMTDPEALAFWANLYNAVTIKVINDNYPVSSIRKIKHGVFSLGPWKKNYVSVNGTEMSLDDIEHATMRAKYPSPLIHYMVNCASNGCPNLKDGLWRAESLDADREAAARAFINSPRGVRVTSRGLKVSSIYKWFQDDFGGNKAGVTAHLSDYAQGDLKAALEGGAKISGYDYDWSLNE